MKGFMMTVEAVVACMIIALFLIYMATGSTVSSADIADRGLAYDVLESLDQRGVLRGYAESLDYTGLDAEIDLPQYNHSVAICVPGGSCYGNATGEGDVWSGSYFIAGKGSYSPREVRLFIWRHEA